MAIKHIVFDWGDTLMRDLPFAGSMKEWPAVFLIPDIDLALNALQDNYQLYVGSNAGDSVSGDIESALKRVGIGKYFERIFSSKDIGYEKPDPRFFETIRYELKALPEEILMIGNSCEKDMKGANTDGWFTIWFNENQLSHEICKCSNAAIYHMSQVVELIDEINQSNDI